MTEANEKRSAAENYATATGASNLRMQAHQSGAAEVIGAAGMSPYETGTMLMRVQGEWDRAAKPPPPTRHAIEALAASYDVEPATTDGSPNRNAGLVKLESGGRTTYRKPIYVAEDEATRWHNHELGILAGHLKTLPAVRAELTRWLGGPHALRAVSDVLAWWLEPRCATCKGCGKRIVEGTGGRSSGKACHACMFSANPGERPLPHGGIGRKLLSHIRACYHTAANDLRPIETRSATHEEQRGIAKKHKKVAELRRADEEAKADEQENWEAVAADFARSMRKVVV